MSLKDIAIKTEYRSLVDNVAKEFYIPLLSEAISYKRAVGFFSSSILIQISEGVLNLVRRGGNIQIIASPYLSEEDYNAIQKGYDKREIINSALKRELQEPNDSYCAERLDLLANLIADGYLDIKIAVTESRNGIGMYHEKMGIISDSEGNRVAFSGSMNESSNALTANYETIDVYTSWSSDLERVNSKEYSFECIWHNEQANISTLNFENITEEFINKYKKTDIDYETYKLENKKISDSSEATFFSVPDNINFYEYQKEAMLKWFDNGCCGIYDMATGTGKTFTALGSLAKLSKTLTSNLAVIIVAPYQHLVEQWVEDINAFGVQPIIAYSYPGQKWRKEFNDALIAYNIGSIKNFCVITTNATFQSNDFQTFIRKFKKNFCFVADEAHNLGAKKIIELLPKKARYRLALSATLERHHDAIGTDSLKKYFGKTCISFSLKDAINQGFLTPYYYYPVLCHLDDEELDEYKRLTEIISKQAVFNNSNNENSYLEKLLIQRARVVAGCKSKVDKLIEVIADHKDENHILIYCGATKYDRDDFDDEDQIKQIDEVTKRLYTDLKIKARKFTSTENNEERASIKRMFKDESIQAITAIKCLDEGVNIPEIRTAFILASSTNPKEYIQRRGRVLRKSEGKEYAIIYDFITLPRPLEDVKYFNSKERNSDLSLVKREFERMIDFAETARNPADIDKIRKKIQKTYGMRV